MELSFEEIDKYLSKIFSSTQCFYIDDTLFVFKFPSNEIKQRADVIYDKSLEDAIKEGMLPAKQLEELVERRNLITSEDISKLKKLKDQLLAQEVLLSKTTRVKANQDRILQTINRLKQDIHNIEYKKSSKLFLSAENKADEDKTFYICSSCVFNEDGTLLWSNYKEALKENRIELKNAIIRKFLKFYSGISTGIIRCIARSSIWRIRYVSSMKTSDPLFGVPTANYSTDQLSLAYWSNFYQNIYEMLPDDRPSDIVIEDDDALDAYMKVYYEERNREDSIRRNKSKNSSKLSAFESEEVIVTRSHELYQDIKYDTPKESKKFKDKIDFKKKKKAR